MRTPVQRTLISLAVASACWIVGAAAHAQQTQQTQTEPAAADTTPDTPAADPGAAEPASTSVVRISGSRIAAPVSQRVHSMPPCASFSAMNSA